MLGELSCIARITFFLNKFLPFDFVFAKDTDIMNLFISSEHILTKGAGS